MLAPAAIYERPIRERHRIIFYLGHLEAFDWNMICAASFGMPSFNSEFNRLFDFGIDPVDGKLPQDQPADWPRLEQVLSYRDHVRPAVDRLLERATFTNAAERFVENGQIFRVAIEHRLMHAETLAYNRKSTRLNSSHPSISYAVFCLKKKKTPSTYLNKT